MFIIIIHLQSPEHVFTEKGFFKQNLNHEHIFLRD